MMIKSVLFTIVLASAVTFAANADAAKKASKPGSRSDYSEAQQKKFFDQALALCRKKYQGTFVKAKVDYRRRAFVCYHF
jgi:hypothetical protein